MIEKAKDAVEQQAGLQRYRERIVREKRGALLDAAVALFLERGYGKTSLEDIARHAGVSSATLYKHFPTKDRLFGGVMERLWESGAAETPALPLSGAPRDVLTAIGTAYAELLSRDQSVALFRLIVSEATRFPELGQELYERGKKPYLERLHAYLSKEVAAGTLSITDVPLAARQLLGMINDIVFWPRLLIVDLTMNRAERQKVVDGAVETFLARYGTKTGGAEAIRPEKTSRSQDGL